MSKKVELEIYEANGLLGLTIHRVDEKGNGEGWRIFGPKLFGQGVSVRIKELSLYDLEILSDEVKQSIKFLKAKK